jgi:hypothetical protein
VVVLDGMGGCGALYPKLMIRPVLFILERIHRGYCGWVMLGEGGGSGLVLIQS